MKKVLIILLVVIVMFLVYNENKNTEILVENNTIRLRVIPNSNSAIDQKMKNKVKDYLEENTYNLIAKEDNIEEARKKIKENIPDIESNIDKIFLDNNYNMYFKVNYGYNYFPKKEYKNVKYDEGYYESLVIGIGNEEGDNWWCFLFPNLCLIDTKEKNNVEYKSWFVESLNKIF